MVGETKPEHPLQPHRPPFNRRQLVLQVVVAGVILASGIGIGAGGAILVLQDRIVWHIPSPPVDPPRGPRPGGNIGEMLRTQSSLSDAQTQQVKDLFAKRLEAARERRKQVDAIEQAEREKLAEDMKGILTTEQFERWHADYQKMMDDMRNRPFWGPRGDHRGPPHGDRGPGGAMGPEGRRGDRGPRPPMGPNDRHKGDRPPDQPIEINSRPGEVNAPK